MHSRSPWCRVGLLATTALLLGGDTVELEVTVGPGARLDLFDVAGTVAFDGRGRPAGWSARVRVAAGGVLRWSGQPLVVADGADVTREVDLRLDEGAVALLRDTVVLGRTGETGGRLRSLSSIRVADRLVCREEQDLGLELRTLPGVLGDLRVLDTITTVGPTGAEPAVTPVGRDAGGGATARLVLVGRAGTVTRFLGYELDRSPLHQHWDDLSEHPLLAK